MQSYQFTLSPAGNNAASTIYATGNLFVYESASTAGDNRVVVKPDTGGEIILKPGQRFRPDETRATAWNVKLIGPDAVAGVFIIGEGDFDDANIKIDSTSGALTVIPQGGFQIVNTPAQRVPVTMDATQILQTSGATVVLQNGYSNYAALDQAAPVELVAPAGNVRGIMVNKVMLERVATANARSRVYASNGAKFMDIAIANSTANAGTGVDNFLSDVTQYMVPVGYGLYLGAMNAGGAFTAYRSVNWTIL
jgi:hypothetical protein